MLPLRLERAPTIFKHCAPVFHRRITPHAFFQAARHISWGPGNAQRTKSRPSVGRLRRSVQRTPVGDPVSSATINADGSNTDPEEQVTINFLEKDEGSDAEPQPIELGEMDDLEKELAMEEQELDERITTLEEDVDMTELPKEMDEFANQLFTEEERQRIMENLEHNFDRYGEAPHHIFAWEGLPESNEVLLGYLNTALDRASTNPANEKAIVEMWRWYSRCKIYIPGFLANVPDEAWEIMWLSQSEEFSSNPNRASHRKVLANDMVAAGRALSQEQRYGRIEGLFLDGEEKKALHEWERSLKEGPGDAGVPEYLELGIRMYTRHGDLSRAEDLLDILLKLHTSWDPRITIQVISALLALGTDEGYQRAQVLYVRLRQRLGADMTMEDYDSISLMSLQAGRKDFALAAFKDMMLSGEAVTKQSHSFIGRMQERLGMYTNATKKAEESIEAMLSAMSYMPKQFQNKFFYAKWLRKLISMDEPAAAGQVLELMYERGVKPDAQHVNGLISAWLRNNTPETRSRAEQMGWNMIQARLDFVHSRRVSSSSLSSSSAETSGRSVSDNKEAGVRIPTWIQRPTPPGNIETFCILVKYYLENEMFENVRHLRNLLVYAEISMNSVFMNHLLYAELRFRSHRHVWARFEVMSRTVVPDIETWICLWECMKFELSNSPNPDAIAGNKQHSYPTPRKLFATMMQWFAGLSGRPKRDALEDMEIDTYNDILRCFFLARDLTGAIVAVRSMTDRFDIWPTPVTVRMLLLQISKMSTQRNREGRKWRQPGKIDMEDKMTRTTEALNLITQYRRDQLGKNNVDFDKLNGLQQAEESLRTIMQFLHTVLRRRQDRSVSFQTLLNIATSEMGVEQMDASEMMALVA